MPTDPRATDSLPVVETFHSLQGEGLHAGRSAFFIRLGGCTVGCSWCDTKQSWPTRSHGWLTLQQLLVETQTAKKGGAAFVVITGGEPLHHDLGPLCRVLATTGVPLHLETSGVDSLSGQFDWITLSPKPHSPPSPELLGLCHELKVVVHEDSDLSFAESMAEAAAIRGNSPALTLQPGWNNPKGHKLAIAFVQSNASWRLSLQSHKWLGLR